jgi:6-pyruvoyltetrahydropterin/6-carboxytetrahydropterin synthase
MFQVRKTYGHEEGLSCVFRQWRAKSHCSKLHGYALGFEFTFGCNRRDENGWVLDFGALKPIKAWLHKMFDHTTVISHDDPLLTSLTELDRIELSDIRVLKHVGCEAFAYHAGMYVQQWLNDYSDQQGRKVFLVSCRVFEHGGNSAIWIREP